ncbi:competence/damage-inducible protein A [Mesonia sp. K7]|uniref:competence/damage-inducible protein A n=1 Tax=Mesonia sp. K7 TaxID=2218606 RepID=UPI000DAA76C4|nr:competence/damage-inducible protein A [Mesonia sp. K7]PZD77282.1 competence/damage-inducible protein A [Mesonia sp. K7]
MQSEIITIGDEILIGQIVDTNSAFIAKEFNAIGIEINQITSIQDDQEVIYNALKEASERSKIVVITGGLGPTNDDVTKKTLCDYFDDKLVLNQEVLDHIEDLFENHLHKKTSQLNRDQALLPSKAKIFKNKFGTASGMSFEKEGLICISLPGVPFEMKNLLKNEVIPYLEELTDRSAIYHKTLLTYGIGESDLALMIKDWEENLPKDIKLAYLPNFGRVRLRLSTKGKQKDVLEKNVNEQIRKVLPLIQDYFKGYEDDLSVEEQIANFFLKNKLTLATAESCTGGKLASELVKIPGVSQYFLGGLVTYATKAKRNVLQIPDEIITEHSVVSKEVTKEMAIRCREMFQADVAIATTGNAGPTKGDSDAKIGTVYISVSTKVKTETFHFQLGNEREKVISKAVTKAQELLLDLKTQL